MKVTKHHISTFGENPKQQGHGKRQPREEACLAKQRRRWPRGRGANGELLLADLLTKEKKTQGFFFNLFNYFSVKGS